MIKLCYDMDGVICEDISEVPGTKAYVEALKSVKSLSAPHHDNIDIVTGRTEQYRKYTENWLKQHNITYKQLIMKPISLKGVKYTPKFKADYYRKTNAVLFIESCPKQAERIAQLSKKPVFCFENKTLY